MIAGGLPTVLFRRWTGRFSFTKQIFQDGYSRIAYFADPDGNEFYMIELKGEWKESGSDASAA